MNLKQIYASSAPLKECSNFKSSLYTECLFGEKVQTLLYEKSWTYCKTMFDNYKGWIHTSVLGNPKRFTHRIYALRSYIYSFPDEKSTIIQYLPMGSKVWAKEINDKWVKIFSPNSEKSIGYVPCSDMIEENINVKDWVSIAEQFVGTPYKWGGRDSLGIDCSALIQISLETVNIKIPRDSCDQIKFKKVRNIDICDIHRGSVIYWEGHVGVMINKSMILHANAHHMKTVVEPLADVIARAKDKKSKIIKIVNFI